MNFLIKFIKLYIVYLALSALGAFVFYKLIMEGKGFAPGVSGAEFGRTIGWAVGVWVGFVTFITIVLALAGMKTSIQVPFQDRQAFLHRVTGAVTSVRYRPQSQSDEELVFKPPMLGGLMAEKIKVSLGQGFATISGPRSILKKIQAKL